MLAIMLAFTACAKVEPIDLDTVSLMTVHHYEEEKVSYTIEDGQESIEHFVNLYNKARPYDNSLGTTPSIWIKITLDTDEVIMIWGGKQGFQTVQRDDKQFNINSSDLWEYFKALDKEYTDQE